jgi:hypothetical protein
MAAPMASLRVSASGLSNDEIINSISNAIEHTLGSGASGLVFRTLKLIYHLDVKSIPADLDYFQFILSKMLGSVICNHIAAYAAKDMDKRR